MSTDWKQLGSKRIAISTEAKSAEDWKRLWYEPLYPYPFEYGDCWNFVTEYLVSDFEAEVGFFTDGLCLECHVLGMDYAMFSDEKKSFYLSFVPAGSNAPTTGFSIQFMIQNFRATVSDLINRGILPTSDVHNPYPDSPMLKAVFKTPNGIPVHLWGFEESK